MPKTIVINSSNYVQGSNNQFKYNFPQTSYFSAGSSIGVSNIAIYNSIFNITQKRGNNKLTIHFLGTDYDITIPDGFFSISQLNSFIQNQCIINKLFVTTNDGEDYVYFLELIVNSVRYGSSLIFYKIPTAEEASNLKYVKPAGATWDFPSEAKTPTLSFGQSFGNLIGFTFGRYPKIPSSEKIEFLNTQTPKISPVDSLILTCNLVNSKYSIPSNVLFSIPISSSLGSLINVNISSIVFNDILSQNFSHLEITFFDQLFNPVVLNDTEVTIALVIKEGLGK
jgi:hypothetical protein